MNSFAEKILDIFKRHKEGFIGVILGFIIFLALSLSAINIILFLMLAVFTETSFIFVVFYNQTPKEIRLVNPLAAKEHVNRSSKQRGRPKGSKNKPKPEQPTINEGVIHL